MILNNILDIIIILLILIAVIAMLSTVIGFIRLNKKNVNLPNIKK